MAKKNDLKKTADELRSLAEQLTGIAEALAAEPAPKTEEPEKELSYSEVRKVLAEKSRAGHTAKIRELLIAHGAEKLSGIDPKEYAAIVREAEVLS